MEGLSQMAVELHVSTKGETTCVALLGEFEVEGLEHLEARLERLQEDRPRPVLDLRRILVVDRAFAERSLLGGSRSTPGSFDAGA
jgi:hypothetical protein